MKVFLLIATIALGTSVFAAEPEVIVPPQNIGTNNPSVLPDASRPREMGTTNRLQRGIFTNMPSSSVTNRFGGANTNASTVKTNTPNPVFHPQP